MILEWEVRKLYEESDGMLWYASVWLPPAEETEFVGTEDLPRVFRDNEVSKKFHEVKNIRFLGTLHLITTILRFIMKAP